MFVNRNNYLSTILINFFCFVLWIYYNQLCVGIGLILLSIFFLRKVEINKEEVVITRFFLMRKIIAINSISEIVVENIPNLNRSLDMWNGILIKYSGGTMKLTHLFSNKKDNLARMKQFMGYMNEKGKSVKLFVPSGEEKKAIFKGYEITTNWD